MLYYLSQQMLDWSHGTAWEGRLSFLRLFRYITVRTAGAAVTALLLSWWLGPKIIHWLKTLKFGQDYKDKAEEAGGLAARAENSGRGRIPGVTGAGIRVDGRSDDNGSQADREDAGHHSSGVSGGGNRLLPLPPVPALCVPTVSRS